MAAPSALRTRDFLWALGVILSRGVSEDGAGGTGLVPYLDFANHGETCSSGLGGGETASCERGFDAATGSHVLRALRDVAPGKNQPRTIAGDLDDPQMVSLEPLSVYLILSGRRERNTACGGLTLN